MDLTSLEKFYTFIYDLHFSSCGKFLACCDNYGYITLFSVAKALEPSAAGATQKHINKWRGDKSSLYCLSSSTEYLFSGGTEGVRFWHWNNITKPNSSSTELEKPFCHVTLPSSPLNDFHDVNDLVYDEKNNNLYVACGWNVYCLDCTKALVKDIYSGHTKYIHSVCLRPGTNQFVTGSEDGSVKIWDPTASKEAVNTIKRKGGNKDAWISSVAIDSSGEWMVVGGLTPPTLYKMGSLSRIVEFDVPKNVSTTVLKFAAGQILSAGSESVVRHWKVNGEAVRSVPVSSTISHVLSIAHNTGGSSQHEVLAVSGDSPNIDIFTHLGYKAFTLSL
ncbi:PREDICTED: THO complex subunit 6 homolog [Amphimedon queenslandica]|uniref:Uncharacterized protein n=1 Tax=Amphimedon queenslandica TaxID=400682 RepID=A0A1X7TXX1_AMPQE|nr:PREDICTED: THO complex subunit 6 homolog [Amphimedon queenslandica]|eukprot:XP_019857035.1 PREDICTED: THO complex subunit 6 homolog [Amphimedon queenslandica]